MVHGLFCKCILHSTSRQDGLIQTLLRERVKNQRFGDPTSYSKSPLKSACMQNLTTLSEVSHGIEVSHRLLSHRLETLNRLFWAENEKSVGRFLIFCLKPNFWCFDQKSADLNRGQRIRSECHSCDVMLGHESYFLWNLKKRKLKFER